MLVLLLPGFTASIVLDLLIVRKPKDNLPKIVEALVLSFLVYALLAGVLGLSPYQLSADGRTVVNPVFVIAGAGAALSLPIMLAFLSTNDIHMKVFRFLRISTKTARDTTWLDVFTNHKQYVIVNLTGKRRVFGWPMYFSNNPDEGLLYLYDPAWIKEDGTYTELNIHGLFLLERSAIESIEFLNLGEANAKPRAKAGAQ